MNGHVKTITRSQKTMTPTTNLKYDPQYAAAAAEGILTGRALASREGDGVLHSIHRAAVPYTDGLRISSEQKQFFIRAFKAAAHHAYNESRTAAA
jgi:hypothetical protein